MDACEAVEKEIEKVIKKFTDVKSDSIETINEIISVFSVLMNSLGKQKKYSDKLWNVQVQVLSKR